MLLSIFIVSVSASEHSMSFFLLQTIFARFGGFLYKPDEITIDD